MWIRSSIEWATKNYCKEVLFMSISMRQQLEAFAYWRRQLVCAHGGQELWGLAAPTEAKLMNQAPLYALGQERVDFYMEAPLL